jgi:hypothetical protein
MRRLERTEAETGHLATMYGLFEAFSRRLDPMFELKDANLLLRALIILGLIGFAFFIAVDQGLVRLALDSDKSYISYLILGIYLLASLQWLYLAHRLGRERTALVSLESVLTDRARDVGWEKALPSGVVGQFVRNAVAKGQGSDSDVLLAAVGDELANAHALGHFISDTLLRLGLLGTIVGFIFMLLPIGEMEGFDAGMMQNLLTAMSGGMAVALYTTLTGLITSTLLKLQYHVLDASAAELVTRLSVVVDVHFAGEQAPSMQQAAG